MSASQKANQLKIQFDLFEALEFENFFRDPGSYAEWDGYNIQEFRQAVEFVRTTLRNGFEKKIFFGMPMTSLNSLLGQLTSAMQQCQSLLNNRGNLGVFQSAANGIDSLVHHLSAFGVPYMIAGGVDVQEAQKQYESETRRLAELSANAESLNKSVKNLIEPAISGSLSKSFSDRRRSLFVGRVVWGLLTVGTLLAAIYATAHLIEVLSTVFSSQSGRPGEEKSVLPLLLLRTAIIVPIYIALGFFFSQYRKERDLEEEYAHKAAVATTLPNYGDLAKDPVVKDQIVSGASNVIFTSPIRKVQDIGSESLPMESVKGLLEAASKFVKKQ